MKIWAWVFIGLGVLQAVGIYYLNFTIYAGVLTSAAFFILAIFQIVSACSILFGRRVQRAFISSIAFFACFVIFLVIAIPPYTYNDAQQLVEAHVSEYEEQPFEMYPLDRKTIPTTENSSWFLYNKAYYIAVKVENEEQSIYYYAVNPVEGKPVKMDEPY